MEQRNAVADEGDPATHDADSCKASQKYDSEYLREGGPLYATMEPCVMCKRALLSGPDLEAVKFAVTEKELGTILSGGLDMPSTEFAQRSPRVMKVEGPFPEVHDEAFAVMKAWVDKILGN